MDELNVLNDIHELQITISMIIALNAFAFYKMMRLIGGLADLYSELQEAVKNLAESRE